MNAVFDGAGVAVSTRLRVAVVLDGNPNTPGAAGTKFGLFVESLNRHPGIELVAVGDSTLSGPSRAVAAALSWRPNQRAWKEHYRKNPLTFQLRTHQSRRWVARLGERPEVVLQVGAMSRPGVPADSPYALFLDFTYALTEREWPARAPMLRFERRLWRRAESQVYEQAGVIFCRSQHVAQSLRDDYKIAAEKVHVVGAGVNVPLPDIATLNERDRPRVLFIGSDFRRKGGDLVLKAWPKVRRRVPDAELIMIGPVEGVLPAGASAPGGGWDSEAIVRELRRSSVFVMPSRCETWGDVFIEAMAYSLPCIGASNDAMPEIIKHGRTGLIVPPEDPDALAASIIELLLDPQRAAELGAAGRRRVEERYLWPQVIDQMLPAFAEISDRDPSALPSAGVAPVPAVDLSQPVGDNPKVVAGD